MVRVHVVFVCIVIVVMIFHAIYCNKQEIIGNIENSTHKSIVMDQLPVQYAMKDMVRVSKIIIRKFMVRVHVVFVCIILVVLIFHAIL